MKLISGYVLIALLYTQSVYSATLDVSVHGLTSRKGVINITIWKDVKGFLKIPEEALSLKVVPIAGPDMTVRFDGLEQGHYAVLAYHDQNSNCKLGMGFMGPKEPYGISNNIRKKLGPPSFEETEFNVTEKIQTISITIK